MDSNKAILLLAFGGADSLESVEPFVRNVLKGRPVTPELIEKTKERYGLIGGKSPLLEITNAQAGAIEEIANRGGAGYKAYVGMRYWHPFIKETIEKMKADGVEEAVAVIMAPFPSRVATGGYQVDVNDAVEALGGSPRIEFIRHWHINARYIDVLREKIEKELADEDKKDYLVIFSNHSLPVTALEGDPYEMQIHQTVDEVVKLIGPIDYKVAFQSRGSGPREWLGPQTESVIEEAARRGKKGVLVVPLGFVADHIETLYDIDILFREIAQSNGLVFKRAESLNATPKFMELLADIAVKHIEKKQ